MFMSKGRVGSERYIPLIFRGSPLVGRVSTVIAADGIIFVKKSYYHLDHLNSTKAVTDESGELEVLYEYRAFGEQLKRLDDTGPDTEDSAKYSFWGKELDDTELYYFNARYYDAAIGRFVNVDPISTYAGTGDIVNYYNLEQRQATFRRGLRGEAGKLQL